MFRRTSCALAAVAGLGLASSAQAHPPTRYPSYPPYPPYPVYRPAPPSHAVITYRVYYRSHYFAPWRMYGSYYNEWQARSAARHLNYRGYEVMVRAR